ncbi:carboxylating nicotinate-nucleotide diphosphorylase [bacterium]|nr:carboxylating nicotinate-nucleotide diphosphorylase [bacterium]
MRCPDYATEEFVSRIISEDLGRGDITTNFVTNEERNGRAFIKAKSDLVLCGIDLAAYVFKFIDEDLEVELLARDGEKLCAGEKIMNISGNAASILKGERTALNLLQRLSGIASLTAEYVKEIDKYSETKIADTRKTTPGLRTLEKYAVRTGGGSNHRFGLDDGVMIKDNHIVLAGSITQAVENVRSKIHHLLKIEVETTNLDEVKEALAARADVIMLDNMDYDMMAEAIETIGENAKIEISGGVTLEKINELSKLGADFISVGALTHSAVAKDINLTLEII